MGVGTEVYGRNMSNRIRPKSLASHVLGWARSADPDEVCDVCGDRATEVGSDSMSGDYSRCDEHWNGYDR